MNNNNKNKNQGNNTVELFLEKDVYKPGDNVLGDVFINIKENYQCSHVFIIFKGEIFAKSYLYTLEGNEWVQKDKNENKQYLIKLKSLLQTFGGDGILQKGVYKIKFDFQLPVQDIQYNSCNVKGSYGITLNDSMHYYMHTKYSLYVIMPNQQLLNEKNLKKKTENQHLFCRKIIFMIKQHELPELNNQIQKRINYYLCFCYIKDFYEYNFSLKKSALFMNDTIIGSLKIDTTEKLLAIQKITFLIERILIYNNTSYAKVLFQEDCEQINLQNDFEFKLPVALPVTHQSMIAQIKYLAHAKIYQTDQKEIFLNLEFQIKYCAQNPIESIQSEVEQDYENEDSEQFETDEEQVELNMEKTVNWNQCISKFDWSQFSQLSAV